jgi:hypothetical protein
VTLTFRNVECTRGDVNGDGVINEADLERFREVIADPAAATPAQRGAADINLDGFADGADECPMTALLGLGGFRRGDANDDRLVDISDALFVLAYLFSGGRSPLYPAAADANADSAVEISDPIYLLDYLFSGGPEPSAPFHEVGCGG